jgi:hypothetical protein
VGAKWSGPCFQDWTWRTDPITQYDRRATSCNKFKNQINLRLSTSRPYSKHPKTDGGMTAEQIRDRKCQLAENPTLGFPAAVSAASAAYAYRSASICCFSGLLHVPGHSISLLMLSKRRVPASGTLSELTGAVRGCPGEYLGGQKMTSRFSVCQGLGLPLKHQLEVCVF